MVSKMKVIVCASHKGGSGKTTLTGHLAVEAERRGFGPALLIDVDPQGSLSKWYDLRVDLTPNFLQSVFVNLHQDIIHASQKDFRLVFIDVPPAGTRIISETIAHADLVIIPTRPSPHDMRSVNDTVDVMKAQNKDFLFVLNGAMPGVRITSEAVVALTQHGQVAPTIIHQHEDYAASMVDGRTVMEINPLCDSSIEIAQLWKDIQDIGLKEDMVDEDCVGQVSVESDTLVALSKRQFGRRAFG